MPCRPRSRCRATKPSGKSEGRPLADGGKDRDKGSGAECETKVGYRIAERGAEAWEAGWRGSATSALRIRKKKDCSTPPSRYVSVGEKEEGMHDG